MLIGRCSVPLQAQSLADKSLALKDSLKAARADLKDAVAEQEAVTIVRDKLQVRHNLTRRQFSWCKKSTYAGCLRTWDSQRKLHGALPLLRGQHW